MTEIERCRAHAEADLTRAEGSALATVRDKHRRSAAVWIARAALLERAGLTTKAAEAA